jgi:NADH-quinone oxidoreductase subunit C
LSSSETSEATDTVEEAAEAPRDEAREELLATYAAELGDAVVGSHIRPGADLWIRVQRDAWPTVAEVSSRKLGFDYFDFLSAIDWLPSPFGRDMDSQEDLVVHGAEAKEPAEMAQGYAGGETRFQVFARLLDLGTLRGVTFKADLPDDDLRIGSWTQVFGGANWHERETWEMYGITFDGHPQLVKLYLPGDFEGSPLRKDFPLLSRRLKPWPGIVDVEQLPAEDEADEPADGSGGAS